MKCCTYEHTAFCVNCLTPCAQTADCSKHRRKAWQEAGAAGTTMTAETSKTEARTKTQTSSNVTEAAVTFKTDSYYS